MVWLILRLLAPVILSNLQISCGFEKGIDFGGLALHQHTLTLP